MVSMSQKLILKWNNHVNLMKEFKNFLSFGTLVDVTLACDGQSLKAHKIVLSACSSFFKSLFLENTCSHPIVILKDVKYAELKAIVDFMYCGELNLEADRLASLVKIAQTLKVNGLGDVEAQNDDFRFESENYSGDESEHLSHDESINDSICTVDVQNGSLEENLDDLMVQNDLIESSDVVILETPEIKEEEVFDVRDNPVPSSSASVKNLSSSSMTSFKNGDIMPVLAEQTTIPKEVHPPQPMKLFKNHSKNMSALDTTSAQVLPSRGLFENHSENVPTLTTAASMHISLEQPFQSSIPSSNELFENHSENMSVVTSRPTCASSKQLDPSSVQSNMKSSQNHSNVSIFPLKTSIHVSRNNLCSVASTIVSGRQSLQSSAQSNMKLSQSNHSGNLVTVISSESTHSLPVCSSVQSTMELHQNQSNSMSKLPPKISSYAPPRNKFQASAKKLHQNHSDNVNKLSSATSSIVSGRQLFQSSTQSNIELSKSNHSGNLISVHSSEFTHSPPVHSSQSSVQSNMELYQNQSRNVTELPSKISTSVSPRQLFPASTQSGFKHHQKHSDNIHSLSLGKSTVVLQGQSSQCSTQSVIQSSESNHSKSLSTLVSVVSSHTPSNAKASNKNLSSSSPVSPLSRHGSSCTKRADNKQTSSSSASDERKKKLKKCPSSMCRNQPLKKKTKEKEVYQLPNLRKPEIIIIDSDEAKAKQGRGRPKGSKKKKDILDRSKIEVSRRPEFARKCHRKILYNEEYIHC